MLEVKNLTKVYKSKGGVTVRALDGVSIKFPSTGLVFLLGKSGSGKSTLLNVTGGLDKPDDGEIIIKGRNSKTFSGSDFDSYRNTFIGFIFQEYNILNEFNVEQNISLALQLQGKKNDKDAVDEILKQVDLEGYGKRKPNTLSGGQKQRIAIARALIKNPEIIMADEPTGALDSNTGKQVFDTLKKLSKEKLIIVVSHDRDFAEIYGDRIIELSDGKVISDVTKEYKESSKLTSNVEVINENVISIKNGDLLCDEDLLSLKDILKKNKGEIIISMGEKQIPAIKQVNHIRDDNKSEIFEDTKEVKIKEYDGKETKFIKSRLPMARAFKMGSSSLKTKPIRMIFTCLLTIVALVMFGVASTLLFYNPAYSISSGLEKSVNDYETVYKSYGSYYINNEYDNTTKTKTKNCYESDYEQERKGYYSESEITNLNKNNVGHHYVGIFGDRNFSFREFAASSDYYKLSLNGYIDASFSELDKCGITLVSGKSPETAKEIAISKYFADGEIKLDSTKNSYQDIIGMTVELDVYTNYQNYRYDVTIVGIYDCGMIPSKFDTLKETKNGDLDNQLNLYLEYSFHNKLFVSSDFYTKNGFTIEEPYVNAYTGAEGVSIQNGIINNFDVRDNYMSFIPSEFISDFANTYKFIDANGNSIEYKEPKDNQIYLPYYEYQNISSREIQEIANRIVNMSNEPNYSSALSTYLSSEENRTKLDKILYPEKGYTKEIYEQLLEFYNTYYSDYIYHLWLVKQIRYALYEIGTESKEVTISNFDDFTNKVYNYLDRVDTTDSVFNEIKEVYEENKEFFTTMITRYGALQIAYLIIDTLNDSKMSYIPIDVCDQYKDLAFSIKENIKGASDNDCKTLFALSSYLNVNYTSSYDFDYYVEFNLDLAKKVNITNKYYLYYGDNYVELEVLGYIDSNNSSSPIISLEFIKSHSSRLDDVTQVYYDKTNYTNPVDAKYSYAITKTNYSKEQIANLLQEHDTYNQEMTNYIYQTVKQIVNMISMLKKVFLIIGLVFAVFAALMLFNFISSSISSKTKEIGILRAIGTRGSDLFKIFFSESGIIAFICFIISIIISIITCYFMNKSISEGIGIRVMDFNVFNILIIIAGSILIAIIGTFIPVFRASRRAPIDSIRTL